MVSTGIPEVIVLFEGYSEDKGDHMLANCTCTLIKGPPNIIIDTMTPWDGEKLKQALRSHNLNCEDIEYVVNTHSHSDHIGCNYLFQQATHISGFCVSHKNKYFDHSFKGGAEFVINSKLKVIPTPGHTLQDVSLILDTNQGIVAVTGDLFENERDLEDDNIWMSAGSDSEDLQRENRKKILQIADYIIPGHGSMFKVDKRLYV